MFNGYSTSDNRLYHKNLMADDDSNSTHTNNSSKSASKATPTFQLVRRGSIRAHPQPQIPQDSPYRIDIYSVGVLMDSKLTGQHYDPEQVKVEAESPSGRIIRLAGDGHYSAQFTSDEIGRWRVSMYYQNKFMDGCPVDVCDPSQVRVRELRGGHVGKMQTFQVDCTGAGQGELEVVVTHKGKRVTSFVKETATPKLYKVNFTPYDLGPYEVNVLFNKAEVRNSDFHSTDPEERQRRALFNTTVTRTDGVILINASCDWEIDYVTGGPFIVHTTDSSNIEVYGMKDGTVCSNPELIADCTKVGEGTLTADVTYNGTRCPCKVRKDQPAVYHVSFKPRGPGVYKIWMNYDGAPVKGSPFVQEIAELGSPVAFGDGLMRGMPSTPQTFTIDPRGHPGHITAEVDGPTQSAPCQVTPQHDGTLLATYVPKETGPHKLDVRLDGKPIEGSPFRPHVVDPSRVRIADDWTPHVNEKGIIPLHVNREKTLPFDASRAGQGELSAEVRGPSGRLPVAVDARNDGRQTVLFTPREEGKHLIDVKWGGFPLQQSPYEGYAVPDPDPIPAPVNDLIVRRTAPQAHSQPPVEDKDIIPLTVGQERELPFDTSDTGPGNMTASVQGPNKQLPVAVVQREPGKPSVFFTPQEEGKHLINVNWNDSPLSSSPFIGYASREPNNNVYQPPLGYPFHPDRPKDEDKDIIPLKVNQTKQIPFDTTKAGPGQLTAEVRGPTHIVPHAVEDRGDGKPVVTFTPQEEGKHSIDVNWNGVPLPQSPLLGYATREPQPNGYPSNTAPIFPAITTPSDKVKDEDKDIIPLKVNQTKQIPFDTAKAGPGQLTAKVRGPTHTVPHTVEDRGDGKPSVSFTPEEEGKHYVDVNWNGVPLPQSPLLGYATRDIEPSRIPNNTAPVFLAGTHPSDGYPRDGEKDIIPLKVNKEKALPFDATRAGPGKLTGEVRGPTRRVPVGVEDRKDGKPSLFFTPEEEGKHAIDVNWNGRPIAHSPLIGYAAPDDTPRYKGPPPVYLAGYNPKGGKPYDREKDIIPLKVNQPKQLPFDATEAGPGTMTAAVRGPNRQIPVNVEDRKNGKPCLNFIPEEEGKHLIDVDWNGTPVAKSPLVGYATRDPQPVLISPGSATTTKQKGYPGPIQHSSRAPSVREDPDVSFRSSLPSLASYEPERVRVLPPDPRSKSPDKIILSGRGLKEAEVDKPAFFNVDGTQATPGKPSAHLEGVKTDIPVYTEPVRPQVHRCTYVPKVPGAYKLHVKWNDQPLKGSPFKVNVRSPPKPEKKGLVYLPKESKSARPGEDVMLTIDHPDHNNLTVKCTDPRGQVIPCRFLDNLDGTRSLKMNPTMPGRHRVDIKHNKEHIMGSPYHIDVKQTQIIGRVRVWGPGIESRGVLNHFESHFWVDTTGAGGGELRVRIMGPKGAFKVKMRRSNDRKKLYQCFYDPVEAGIYTMYVDWSGDQVDGSPFTVFLAKTKQELDMMNDQESSRLGPPSPYVANGSPPGEGPDFLY
ncbi:hypothetical protein ACOMHN_014623 [Nucella lapillus]